MRETDVDEIRERFKALKVSVLPDVFLDRIVSVGPLDRFYSLAKEKIVAGGGSIRGFTERDVVGGNAINIGKVMASLGAKVNLIVVADGLSEVVLQRLFSPYSNVVITIIDGRPGYTVALEFEEKGRGANVMISDVGDVENWDGEKISGDSLNIIADSDAVVVTNWSSNNSGTKLATKVFSLPKRSKRLAFLDLADPSDAIDRFPELLDEVIRKGLLDALSLNENEMRVISRLLGTDILPEKYNLRDVVRVADGLARVMNLSIEGHVPQGACSVNGNESESAEAFVVEPNILTGAGDSWNAADILATISGFHRRDRIIFANACSATYISGKEAKPPSLESIMSFLSSRGVELHSV